MNLPATVSTGSGVGSSIGNDFVAGNRLVSRTQNADLAHGRSDEVALFRSGDQLHCSIRRQSRRRCAATLGRSIRQWCERNRIFGTRMYAWRSRTVPPRASTAAYGCAGTSGSGAARSRKYGLTIPVEFRAWLLALIWERYQAHCDQHSKGTTVESNNDLSGGSSRGQNCSL